MFDAVARRLRTRWRALTNREGAELDLDDELRFHLDMETAHLMRMGLSEGDARRQAQRDFGGVERYRDDARDARGVTAVEDFIRDLKVSARSLRRAPGFALVSIFTVALGIGATTAVFSLVDGIMLRPLPYPDAASLVRIYERSRDYPASSVAAANFFDIERNSRTLQAVAIYGARSESLLGLAQPVRVAEAAVSDRFFDVLGVRPALGRGFQPGEGKGGDLNAVVISDRLWRNALNSMPDWENHLLRVDGGTRRIVGVMPPGFAYPAGADLWAVAVDDNPSRTAHNWQLIARLKPQATIAQARTELDQLFGSLKRQLGRDIDAEGVTIRTLREALTVQVKTLILVLLSAVVLVLLVACTNLASANLARGESQQREIAVRASLGAGRGRLVRQLATEKLLLSATGGILGIVLAWIFLRAAVAIGSSTIPAFATVQMDVRVMAFGFAVAMLTGLITGVIPALRVTSDLRSSAASSGGGAGKKGSFRRPLIMAEVALATTLVIGAGLFLRSFQQLVTEDPGFSVDQIVVGDVTLPTAGYTDPKGWPGDTIAIPRFYGEVLARLRAIPGADAVSLVNQILLANSNSNTRVAVDGSAEFAKPSLDYRVIDSAYFGALGIPLAKGRLFTSADRPGAEHVVIVNRDAADRLWPGQNPIGHRIRPPGMDVHSSQWLTVVGVVGNVKQDGVDQPVSPQMYVHYLQRPERLQSASIVVKTRSPQATIPAIRAAVRDIDRDVLVEMTSMEELLDLSVSSRRFTMTVLTLFSSLALFLAAIGIYGVLAYAVVQRQREIGVRMALGLTGSGVGRLILRDAMKAVAPGVVIGLVAAYVATRFIRGMLYGIAPVDPLTFVVTPAVILGVALAASVWPATRAAKVDPLIAMRAE